MTPGKGLQQTHSFCITLCVVRAAEGTSGTNPSFEGRVGLSMHCVQAPGPAHAGVTEVRKQSSWSSTWGGWFGKSVASHTLTKHVVWQIRARAAVATE